MRGLETARLLMTAKVDGSDQTAQQLLLRNEPGVSVRLCPARAPLELQLAARELTASGGHRICALAASGGQLLVALGPGNALVPEQRGQRIHAQKYARGARPARKQQPKTPPPPYGQARSPEMPSQSVGCGRLGAA